jgi:outer membrane lipoprotein-sorting protein
MSDFSTRLPRRAVLALSAAALLTAAPLARGFAASRAIPAKLDDKQKAEVARIETYLNSIRTLRAHFFQVDDNGAIDGGTVLLSRPGRMKIDYDPPSPHLIVADGTFLIYHEKRLNQTSYLPLGSSLAGFLVRENIKLSGDVTVTAFEQQKGVVRATLMKSDEPDAGQLTLVFSDNPLQLRQWTVTDGQGGTIRITLENPEFGVPLDRKLFVFDAPERERPSR